MKNVIERTKKFVDDHKKAIVIGGVTVAGVATVVILKDKVTVKEMYYRKFFDNFKKAITGMSEVHRKIDEQIFTDLAPEIEDMVLSEFVEDGYLDRTYELGNVLKKVEVTIKKV